MHFTKALPFSCYISEKEIQENYKDFNFFNNVVDTVLDLASDLCVISVAFEYF